MTALALALSLMLTSGRSVADGPPPRPGPIIWTEPYQVSEVLVDYAVDTIEEAVAKQRDRAAHTRARHILGPCRSGEITFRIDGMSADDPLGERESREDTTRDSSGLASCASLRWQTELGVLCRSRVVRPAALARVRCAE